MASRFSRVLLASMLVGSWMISRSSAVEYGVVIDGNWSDAATWTPSGGPPGAADSALIGLGSPPPASFTASVVLDVDPTVASVQIGQGTLDLSGRSLTSGELRLLDSAATIIKNGGNLQLGSVVLQSSSTLDIDAADSLTGFVQVSGASELDLNKALTLEGVTIFGGGIVNANDDLAVTTGLIEVKSGGDLNAGGALSAASVLLENGQINLNGNTFTCIGLSLDGSSAAVNKASGSVQISSVNLLNGADLAIDAADNLSRSVYINGLGSHFVFNKALNLTGDITIGGFGVLDTYGDVSANTAGIYLSGDFHLHGNTFTVNSLTLENSGTIHREGGSIQVGSIRVYNAAVHAIEADESLTGFVIVEDPDTLLTIDRNVSLTGEVFVTSGGHLTTTGTLETNHFRGLQMVGGSTFDAGGDVTVNAVPHGVGIADGATLNLHGHRLTTGQLSVGYSPWLGGNMAGNINRGTGGSFSANTLYVSYGSTLSVEPADTLTQLASVDGDGTSLNINKNLTLTDRIVVANGGELNTTATLDVSGFHGLQVIDATANLGADVNVPTGAIGITDGGTVELNGHSLTASQLYLGYSTVSGGTSAGTLNRGTGGSIDVVALFVYNGSTFSVEADDQIELLAVTGAGSQLDLNKAVELTGPASVTDGATLNANHDLTATDFTVSDGSQATTGGALEVNGFYGLQISDSSFSAGGDIDAHLTVHGVGVVNGGTLNLNGHALMAPYLDLGFCPNPNIASNSAGVLDRGAGGAIHVTSVSLYRGSTLTIEPADTVTAAISVDGGGSKVTLNRDLSISGAVTLTNGGALATNGHDLTVAGEMSISPGTLDRSLGGNIDVNSLSASNAATVDLRAGDTVHSVILLTGNSTAAVQQFTGDTTGLTLADNTSYFAIEENSLMVLTFDAGSATDDWAFRWANPDSSTNRIAEILALNEAGRLNWNSVAGLDVLVRDLGDGFTYVMLLPIAGADYNQNGVVDTGDYVLWRKWVGSTTYLAADGNHNGIVDDDDYELWKSTYGELAIGGGSAITESAVPEPGVLPLVSIIAICVLWLAPARRSRESSKAIALKRA